MSTFIGGVQTMSITEVFGKHFFYLCFFIKVYVTHWILLIHLVHLTY